MKPFYVSVAAVLLLFVIIASRSGSSVAEKHEIILSVPGIPGPYCAYGLEKRLLQLEEVERVQIDWVAEHLVIEVRDGENLPGAEEIDKAIQAADYPYRYTVLK